MKPDDEERETLMGTERMKDALDTFDRFEQLTLADIRGVVMMINDQDEKRKILRILDEGARQGLTRPAQFIGLESRLRADISDSFHIIEKTGGLTAVASMIFDRSDEGNSWNFYNPDILTMGFKEGGFARISGLPRMGKTNLACVIMERWAAKGYVALSNILPRSADSRYIYVKDAKALFLAVSGCMKRGVPWLFILDEGGLVWAKQDVSTRRAKDLEKLVRVIGKMHGRMAMIDQREDAIPTTIQQFSKTLFFCHKPGVLTIELRDYKFHAKIHDFPRTDLPFDTYDIAFFDVNVSIPDVLEGMSGEEDPAEILRVMVGESDETRDRQEDRSRPKAAPGGMGLHSHSAAPGRDPN